MTQQGCGFFLVPTSDSVVTPHLPLLQKSYAKENIQIITIIPIIHSIRYRDCKDCYPIRLIPHWRNGNRLVMQVLFRSILEEQV